MNWNKTITFFLILAVLVLCLEAERKISKIIASITTMSIKDITPRIDFFAVPSKDDSAFLNSKIKTKP